MHIAIIGATGMIGKPVAQELRKAGFSIRIIARDVAAARRLFPGTEIAAGDLRTIASLIGPLQGIDTVYLNLSVRQTEKPAGFHTEEQGIVNLIEAVKQAGVRRIAYLSSIVMRYQDMDGFSWWVFAIKQKAVQLLKASGIPYTIFYPSCFMESLNTTQRVGRFVLQVDRSSVRPWYIAAEDYGKQVARAFQIAQEGQHQEYVIQGPEAITQHEAAERFVKAYPTKKLVTLTVPSSLIRLGRLFSAQADYGWHITKALNGYPEVFEAQQTWTDLGVPQTTVERFADSASMQG